MSGSSPLFKRSDGHVVHVVKLKFAKRFARLPLQSKNLDGLKMPRRLTTDSQTILFYFI
jgi:hypothetical protein